MANRIFRPKKDYFPNEICPSHLKKLIPCIEKNFQGCITPHPNPGMHAIYMCPDCWSERQEMKRKSPYRW